MRLPINPERESGSSPEHLAAALTNADIPARPSRLDRPSSLQAELDELPSKPSIKLRWGLTMRDMAVIIDT